MGIGQKIKDAIHHDSPSKTSTYENDKPPGSFPSDTTGAKHNNVTDGRDYPTTGTTGTTGTSGTTGTTGTTGTSRHNPTSNIHGGATGDVAGTGKTGHYPTDSGIDVGHGSGHSRTGEQGTSQPPYWGSMGRESHGVTGGSGTPSLTGSNARTGYDDPAGTHGPHGNRAGNLADPRVDSDRDHRGAPGGGLTGSNAHTGYDDRTNIRTGYDDPSGTHGPHNTRAANVADPRVDSDRDHRGAPYSGNKDLPLRPNEQYGAYNSRGEGPGAVGGGTYNPTSTAGHHDPTSNVDRSIEGRDFTHTAQGTNGGLGAGNQAQYGTQNPVQNPSLIGANSNDPYDTRMRDRDMGRDRSGHGIAGGATGAGIGVAASQAAHRHHHDDMHNSGYGTGNTSGSHATSANPRGGVDDYSRSGAGLTGHEPGVPKSSMLDPYDESPTNTHGIAGGRNGSSPFNQGHEGAKVMHTCSHCGKDNDISRYFKKDAVYRMN